MPDFNRGCTSQLRCIGIMFNLKISIVEYSILKFARVSLARRYPIKIKAAPKVGNIYWCDLPSEEVVHIPEFWKKRPVLVVSRKSVLRGKVIVLPMTSDSDNETYETSIKLPEDICSMINGVQAWVVCDHPMTVATSRLENIRQTPPRVKAELLTLILQMCHSSIAGGSLHH